MGKQKRERTTRVIALIASLALVVGLVPVPALAAADGVSGNSSGASTALAVGSLEVAGDDDAIEGLESDVLGLAKKLLKGTITMDLDYEKAASMVVDWAVDELLDYLFGFATSKKEETSLNDVMKSIDELKSMLQQLQDTVNCQELNNVLNELDPLLSRQKTYDVYKALQSIESTRPKSEWEQRRKSELVDALGNGSLNDLHTLADVGHDYDVFTEDLYKAMTKTWNIGTGQNLTLMQIFYERLRYKYHWEHQAYGEWSAFQGKCLSLLMVALNLERASLQTRIEILKKHNSDYPDDIIDEGACIERLKDVLEWTRGVCGYEETFTLPLYPHTTYTIWHPGMYSDDTWAEEYWMYKERPEYRYYWTPNHEVLFYAKVNTQNVPQEQKGRGLCDGRLSGIDVKWKDNYTAIWNTYWVTIKYDFWKPFVHYQGGSTPLASADQLITIFNDYGSGKHLYDIFMSENEGNFQGLDVGNNTEWWFVVDHDTKQHGLIYNKYSSKADQLVCPLVRSSTASEDSTVLCYYHRHSSEPNTNNNYIGVGVARTGPETYSPNANQTFPNPAGQVHTRVSYDSALWWPELGDLTLAYEGEGYGALTDVSVDGNPLDPSNYTVADGQVVLSRAFMSELSLGGHQVDFGFENGSHTCTFQVKNEQIITGVEDHISKTFGAKAFMLAAKTASGDKPTYESSNVKVVTVDASGKVIVKGAGTATITVVSAETDTYAPAYKTITVKVTKAANPLKLEKATRTVKVSKLAKAKQTVASANVKKKGQGKVTYSIVKAVKGKKSFKKKFSINKKTGKITVKKSTAKGAYKVTVKAKAAGNANYKAGSKKAVITIKVK